MKKILLFSTIAMAAISFSSCGNKAAKEAPATETVETVATDSTATAATDSTATATPDSTATAVEAPAAE